MAEFSPSDAAFEGFRLTREAPRAVAVWVGLQLLLQILAIAVMINTGAGETLNSLTGDTRNMTPSEAIAMMQRLLPAMALIIPAVLVVQSIIQAGIIRMVLKREQPRALAFGADEWRVFLAQLTIILIFMAAYIALAIALTVLGALVVVAAGAAATGVLAALFFVAVVIAMLVVGVRLSLLAPHAVATGRIAPREAAALTRNRFWPMFGTYLLAAVMYAIVALLFGLISMAIMFMGGVERTPDLTSMATYLHPARLVTSVIEAVTGVLGLIIVLAPSAVIYKRLTNPGAAETF